MNFLDSLKTKIQETIGRIGAGFSAGYKSATDGKQPAVTQTTSLPVFAAIQKSIPQVISPESGAKFEKKIELAKKEEEAFDKPFTSSVMSAIDTTYKGINKYGFEYPSRIVGGRVAGGLETSPTEQFDFSSLSALKQSIEKQPTAFEAIKKVSEEKGLPAPVATTLGFIGEAIIPGPGELSAAGKAKKALSAGEDLLQEAKKYKTAEEFVKAQDTSYTHLTNNAEKINTEGFKVPNKSGIKGLFARDSFYGDGTYLLNKGEKVNDYQKKWWGNQEVNVSIPQNANILENTKATFSNAVELLKSEAEKQGIQIAKIDKNNIADIAKKLGYDGMRSGSEIVIYKPEILKTKSQLTDIWKKANKSVVTPKEEMLKRVQESTAKAEKEFLADKEKIIAKNKQPTTDQKPSFARKVKEELNPFKYQPEPVKEAWKKNVASRAISNEKANEEFLRLADIPEKDSFKIVTDYQAGVETPYTQRIKETFDSLFKEANARGLDVKYQENYVPQIYANTKEEVISALSKFMKDKGVPDEKIADYLQGIPLPREYSNALKLSPSFVKEKAFPNYQTAMEYGLTPKYSHPAQLAGHWRSEMEKSLANRELIDTLKENRAIHTFKAPGDKAVDLPFSTEELYADPKLAKTLNDYFRDEDNLGIGATIAKFGAKASQRMQELVLSGGVPSTNINFFTIGQGVKNLTAAEKSVIGTALRSNFDEATIGWFRANQPYITKMAEEGINMSGRLGNWDSVYSQLSSKTGLSRFFEKSGEKFDDWFNKKTFKSFMPMQEVNIFKNTYDGAIDKGLSEIDARKLAGDTTKAWSGTIEDWGRGKTLQDVINSIFFAPRFREGLINLFANTAKSLSTEISNPSFAINRKFVLGAALTYGAYNALNKKLNGNYMWENESGKEFDLKIPLGDGRYTYIAFLPSVAAFPRNMLSGAIALAKFDMATAGQKFGSVFSMPLKLIAEISTNKDYFGRPIWEKDASTIKKLKDIAKYIGIDQYNHPFVQGVYNVVFAKDGKQKPWYEVVSRMAELPFKFNTQENIDKGKYYEAMDKQQAEREKELEPIRELYSRFQTMKANGQEEEAKKIYDQLPDEAKKAYQSIKSSEKTKATNALKAKIFPIYTEIQELKSQGKIDEATAIYRELSADEKKVYQSLKKTFGSNE